MVQISHVDGVLEVDRVRIRRAGNRYFADVRWAGAHRDLPTIRSSWRSRCPKPCIACFPRPMYVQTLPRAIGTENVFDRVRAVATRHNLNVHDISVQDLGGRLHVEQHVELEETHDSQRRA